LQGCKVGSETVTWMILPEFTEVALCPRKYHVEFVFYLIKEQQFDKAFMLITWITELQQCCSFLLEFGSILGGKSFHGKAGLFKTQIL
jgi:hypothetical protein